MKVEMYVNSVATIPNDGSIASREEVYVSLGEKARVPVGMGMMGGIPPGFSPGDFTPPTTVNLVVDAQEAWKFPIGCKMIVTIEQGH
ncbi:MAG: hypothetical protein E6Q97_05740 [Desulfurellales bacterium]|nr:MAG: hypothetical protein E6Q97_05740 [Desulfurellales bacterium]